MILPSAEALLISMAAGLYLYDSMLLVYCNEGILVASGRADWTMRFGSAYLSVFGKEVFLPNPLFPHRPVYRLGWRLEGGERTGKQDWTTQRTALRPLGPFIWGIAGGLFLALPLGLFTRLGEGALLAALLLIYANIVLALAWLWLHRATFALSGRKFAALAFESLACPPFALNLVRRISRETPIAEDLAVAGRRLLKPERWQQARAMLVARIDEELAFAEDDVIRVNSLQKHRGELMEDQH